jgi:hypothetical protein
MRFISVRRSAPRGTSTAQHVLVGRQKLLDLNRIDVYTKETVASRRVYE